ncbi:GntR family transcriptional regulator [Streptomyces sp. NPDC020096]
MTTVTMPSPTATAEQDRLRTELNKLSHVATSRTAASPAAIVRSRRQLREITDRWLPLALERREAAVGSAADQARWDQLIATAAPEAEAVDPSFTALVLLTGQVRELLRAIHDSAPPRVPIAELTERIADAIEKGTYPAGSSLPVSRLVVDLGETVPRVRLALSDLVTAGVAEERGRRAYVARPGSRAQCMTERLAARLRELIAADVYPPGTVMPTRAELARTLVSALHPVSVALRLLASEGTVVLPAGQRAVVSMTARIPTANSGTPQATRAECPDWAVRPARVHESALVVRSWWRSRVTPQPAALEYHLHQLGSVARQLVPQADSYRAGLPLNSEHRRHVRAVIARAIWLESADLPADVELGVWHAACLATAVGDLLQLTEAVGDARTPPPAQAHHHPA